MKPAIPVGGRTGTAHNPTVRCDEWGTSRSRGTVCDRGTPRLHSWEDVRRPELLCSPSESLSVSEDVDETVFVVDGTALLKDACRRHGLDFRYEKHGNRNSIERVL